MSWTKGELRTIGLGKWQKRRQKNSYGMITIKYQIPAPYDRIVAQLIAELMHAEGHDSHESCRRANYAAKVLDAFGDELEALNNRHLPPTFRSRVLTPILQRQYHGVHDAYTPFVCAGINNEVERLSIEDVTDFYLSADPADPTHIPLYRRNLLYLPDARWHLGFLMGVGSGSEEAAANHYNIVRENHDKIVASILEEGNDDVDDPAKIPLNDTEIAAIISEGLENFFTDELAQVVRTTI